MNPIRKKALIIIPCFNEEQNIVPLLHDLKQVEIENTDLFFLPVNDGSSDNTLSNIKANSSTHLHLVNNLGIGGAVQSGIKYAYRNNFDFAIQMDGDGQHPPSELNKIIQHTQHANLDLCIGSRYLSSEGFQSTYLRKFGIHFLNKLIFVTTGKKIYDCTSGYRLYNQKALTLFSKYYPDKYPEPESLVYALLHKLTVGEVGVEMKERKDGVSSISGFSTLYYMTKVSLAILFLKLGFIFKK